MEIDIQDGGPNMADPRWQIKMADEMTSFDGGLTSYDVITNK